MTILVFEDARVEQLIPITTARPACCITVGSYTLLDLLTKTQQPLVGLMRPHLRACATLDLPHLKQLDDASLSSSTEIQLAVNARLVPDTKTLDSIKQLLNSTHHDSGVVWDGDQIAAVVRPKWQIGSLQSQLSSQSGIESLLLGAADQSRLAVPLKLMSYPHEVIKANMSSIKANLEFRITEGGYVQQRDGVFVAEGAKLGEYVLAESHEGPIVIDKDAQVGPYTLLRGPIYIGQKCRILEHAAIKDAVSLGHTTKIGGEVEASVVEPYSNKQHHGFLGHSYLGSWINLGAGTCNSDLKNTYGTVNMEYPAGKAATGMQFLGCVMGDYSKTAINTGIFTGKVVGVCSMMYGFVTSNVPSFVNYARLFGQITTLPPEVMTATQQRMFSRRKVQQRPCDMQLIYDMFRLTQDERDRFGDALTF